MEQVVYEERQSFPAWISTTTGVILGLGLALSPRSGLGDFWALVLIVAVVCVALWLFSRFHINITHSELRFGFRIFKRNLPLSQIEVGEIRDITFWQGVGIHYVRGTAIWNAKLGRGVLIHYGKRRYLVGSDQPERLQSVLREHKAALAR
ncbi:DUF3093 family protein [bacterium]|nr:DUF3093 family protein [bacterium]MBU1983263.1 DUF3093 family protein [bacterium]